MSAGIGVEVVYAEAGRVWRHVLVLPEGSMVGEVLSGLPGLVPAWPPAAFAPAATAVFGRELGREDVLRDGDRLELLRALPTDPKLARRARAETKRPR